MAMPTVVAGDASCSLKRALSRRALHVLAAAVALLTSATVEALPPVDLSEVAAGDGGFVINGIDVSDTLGGSVSGAPSRPRHSPVQQRPSTRRKRSC